MNIESQFARTTSNRSAQPAFWRNLWIVLLAICPVTTIESTARADLVINEVLSSNRQTNVDVDGDSSDWIELANRSAMPIDVGGYALSDDRDFPRKWILPSIEIPAGGYLLVWCSGKDRRSTEELPDETVPEGLVAHWPLDDGFGDTFVNLARPDLDGYIANAGAFVDWIDVVREADGTGPVQDTAVQFLGGSSWIQTDYPGIGGARPRTVAFWIKTTATDTHGIIGWGATSTGEKWHIRLNDTAANGVLRAIRTEPEGGQNVGATVLNDDRWHHVASVLPEGATTISELEHYVDGILDPRSGGGDRSINTRIGNGAESVTIGSTLHGVSRRSLVGAMADVRIYDVALGEDELQAIIRGEEPDLPPPPPPPRASPPNLHANFQIDSDGETILLVNTNGDIVDEIDVPQLIPDQSYGRAEGLDTFRYFWTPTPLADNKGISSTEPLFVADTSFAPDRGFYAEPIAVTISSATVGAVIRYTRDGSEPDADRGIIYTGPIAIADTTTLRAIAIKAGLRPTNIDTHTYVFLKTASGGGVLNQPFRPPGFPDNWGPNGGLADYEMDPEITVDINSRHYDPKVKEALLALPSMSIVMNTDDFFDAETGIHANPQRKGMAWERPCSVELIYPDGNKRDFQVNAGIRIQGNASRRPDRPKHNMRLLFKTIYGEGKLRYPLFDDTKVEEFDTIILRSGNGDAWFHEIETQRIRSQYIRDEWHRDIQLGMGHLSAHQLHMHLYINGLYWGLYHIFERPNASFLASYLGGQKEDWDAINSVDPLDGDLGAWNEMMSIADAGVGSPQGYAALQEYLDLPNFIDWLLINYYSGNVDWDQKNWYAGRKREDGAGFRFFVWDSERTFWSVTQNRLGLNTSGRPTRIHQRLRANAEYRLLFADHVQRHFFGDGLLTPQEAARHWQARAGEIELPLAAESARFGDRKRTVPYTVDVEWRAELDRLTNDYFPRRTYIVLNQIKAQGLFPGTAAPVFSQSGGHVDEDFELSFEPSAADVFYTVDGSDPRLPGGAISPEAHRADTQTRVSFGRTSVVRARVLDGGEWSAMSEAVFELNSSTLRVTEIMFHPGPLATNSLYSAEDMEFIELQNTGTVPLNLGGISIQRGIDFTFEDTDDSPDRDLEPGGVVLIVRNLAAFESMYDTSDLEIAGEYDGKLSNGGEILNLVDRLGRVLLEFAYSDDWYPLSDGLGLSLEILDPLAGVENWPVREGWTSSEIAGGTPGFVSGWSDRGWQRPGDSNQDSAVDVSDAITLLIQLFIDNDIQLPCDGDLSAEGNLGVLDVSGDAAIDVSDAITLLNFLFGADAIPNFGIDCIVLPDCPHRCF